MDKRIRLKQEFNFPKTTRFLGYIFLISSFFTMITSPILGVIMALVFSYISFSKTSNKIDLASGTIKHKDLPRRISLKKYVHLSLLSANVNRSTYSRSNAKTSDLYKEYRIVILNLAHNKKIILERHSDKELAEERIQELSEVLQRDIVKYNPQIVSRKGRR